MSIAEGQTIPVTPFSFDQDLRFLQIHGKLPLDNSLNIRPLSFTKKVTPDSLYNLIGGSDKNNFKERKVEFWNGFGKISLLPISTVTKLTTHHPYGWSDGVFKSVNGLQQYLSAGIYVKFGPLFIQAQPEFLYASNSAYPISWSYGASNMGIKSSKTFPGQSNLGINVGPVTIAASTENLWWGSGVQSSLMMTNNAPGFLHLTFKTNKPIKTPIGSFEWQIISGEAEGNNDIPEEVLQLKSINQIFNTGISNESFSKYLNAITVSYSPKFLKGVSIGGSRAFISSEGNLVSNIVKEVGLVKAYLPIFDGLFKEKRLAFEDALQWNQIVSLNGRIILPKIKAELYGEYGWNDHKFNMRDLLMSPAHSAAYILGFKKYFYLDSIKTFDLSFELNQMSPGADEVVRVSGSWYSHYLKSIYSHSGEILGAGIGYGANLYRISGAINSRFNRIEVYCEKLQHNPDASIVKWSDFAIGFVGRIKLKSFLFNSRLTGIYSKNYSWQQDTNRFNFMGMIGVSYFY